VKISELKKAEQKRTKWAKKGRATFLSQFLNQLIIYFSK